MNYGDIQRLWVKGLGYVSDRHIYKFKDYSEAVFDTQIISKVWLCKELKKVASETTHISILAGWYGLISIPLLYQTFGEIDIDLYDVDEYTTDIASYIFNEYPKVNVYTQDVVFDDIDYKGQVIINSSCEHMMDMKLITKEYPGKIFALQSNDNKNVKWLHINCAMDTGELIEQSGLTDIMFAASKKIYDSKRIMVIGK
jgi:hypothetical protein